MFKKDRLSDDGIQGIKDWKISKATNMQEMFAYNQLFNPTALKSWKVPNLTTYDTYSGIFDQNGTGNWKWELGGAKQTISFDYPPSYAGTATNRKVQELTYSLSSDTAHLDTVTYSDRPVGEYSVYDLGEHLFDTSNSDRYHYVIIGSNGSPFFTSPALTVDGDKDTSDTSFLGAFAPVNIPQIDGYVAVAKDNAGNIVSNNDGTKINKLPITRIGLNDPPLRISGRDLKFEGNFTVTVHYYQVTVDEGQHAYNTSVNAPKYYVAGHDVYLHVNEQPIGVDQIKQIVHTKDDAGNEVTGAIRGWAPVDTSQIGDKTENLTIHYDGIPDRNLTLTVHVVGAETNNLTHVVYGGSVKPDAKDSIRNASTLERYFGTPTYEWHSDSLARTPMTSTDFNVAKNSGDDDNAWIKVTYADGSSEVKGLKLNLIDTSSLTPVTGQVVTHVNAPGINWDNVIEFRYTDSLNRTQTLTLGQVGTASVSGLDLSQPSARRSYQVTIHYSIGLPDGTVNVPVTVIGAEGQNVVFNKKSTNTAPTITDTDENSHTAISNQGDLSQFGASIAWKFADGSAIDWTKPTLDSDGNSIAKAATVTVHYGDGTSQDVNLNLTIQGSAVTDGSHYAAAANDSVHYDQDISNDATGLISYDGTALTSSTLAGHNISSIAWVTTPDTAVTGTASTPGEHDLTNQQIKITFTDGSVLTKTTTVKVFSGYNDTTKSYTVTSGDVPTADQAKAAIANNADLTSDYGARYAWVKNASGDAMDAGYVTSSSDTTKDAWVKITYRDGKTQIVKVNDLTIKTQAEGLNVTEVNGGLNSHAVASGAPDVGDLKSYFTVNDGSADASASVTGATWATAPDWTSAGDKRGTVTLTFADGSRKIYNLNVHLVGANVSSSRDLSTIRNVLPSTTAESEVSNTSALSPYNASYNWYSDRDATIQLATGDVATPTTTPKTIYLGVVYHKADGSADGKQIFAFNLTVNNNSSNYTATESTTSHGITTHIGAPAFSGWSTNDFAPYITVTKNSDGSVVALTDPAIRSVSWQTAPVTDARAFEEQTAVAKITFADDTPTAHDTLTVNIPVHLKGAKAGTPLTVDSGRQPASAAAKDALDNTSVSGIEDTADGYNWTPSYEWVYSDGHSGYTTTGSYDTAYSASHTTEPAYVQVIYHDDATHTSTQVVPVTLSLRSSNAGITAGNATDADHSSITTHVGAPDTDWNNSNVNDYVHLTYSDDTPVDMNTIGRAGNPISSIEWTTKPDTTNANNTAAVITINFADGSAAKTVSVPTTVVSGAGKLVTSTHDIAVSAETGVDHSTLDGHGWTMSYEWSDASGNTLSAADQRTLFAGNTDSDTATNPDTGAVTAHAKGAYITIHFTKGGANDGTQTVWVPLRLTSDADSYFAPDTDITGDAITAHIVNTDDTTGNNLLNGDTMISYTDAAGRTKHKKLRDAAPGANITWTAGPNMTAVDNSGTDHTATISFGDGSTKNVTINVKLLGATAADQTVDSTQAPAAANTVAQLPSGFRGTASWVDATPDGTGKYNVTGAASYNTTWSATHTSEQGYIEIDYADGKGKQIIPVTLSLRSSNAGITAGNATDADHSSITTHVGAPDTDWNNSNVNDYVHLTYSDDTPVDMNTIGRAGNPISSIEWTTKPDTTNANNTAAVITINFADGSAAKTVSVPTTVVSGAGKLVTSTHDIAVSAETGVDHSTLDGHGWTMSYEWSDASGNTLSAADQRTLFAGNTDSDTATNPDTGAVTAHAKGAYITIHFTKGGANDGTQTVWVPLRLTSDADNINPGTDVHFDTVAGNTVTTHANATLADPASGQITITDNDGNAVTGWHFAGWATLSSGSYHDLLSGDLATDLNDSHLAADGTKDVNNVYAKIRLSDGSYIYTPAMNIHVIGAVGQDVVFNHTATDPHADTADINNHTAIKNTHALVQFGATYTWLKSDGTVIDPAERYFNTRRVDEPVKVRVNYSDGTHQDVDLRLTVRSDADINASNIQGGSVTVNKGTRLDPTHGDNEAQAAITNAGSLTNLSSTHSFTWTAPVDTASVGNKWGKVTVHYADGSESAPVNVIVNVIDSNSEANHYNPIGGEIIVDYNQNVASTVEAKDGIRNWNVMPIDARAAWDPSVVIDTTHANSTVIGKVNVTFGDSSSKLVNVVVHVGPDSSSTDPTHQNDNQLYVPEGQDITTDLNDTQHKLGNAQNGIMNADEMPTNNGGTHYAFKNTVDASREGTVPAIVVVTFPDHSKTEVPINVHIISDASRDHTTPLGQNINKHVDDSISAEEGIQNAAHFTGEGVGFSFEGVTDPSTITRTAGTKGENVVLTYRDGSTKIVPILVNVTDNSGSHTPGHAHHDADDYDPQGKTIERDLHEAIGDAKDGIANASALPNDATYTWTDPAAAGHLTDTTGLKSAQVTVTYADNSTDVVTVYVHVTSDADRDNPTGRPIMAAPNEHLGEAQAQSGVTGYASTARHFEFADGITQAPATTGTYNTAVKITYADGSSKVVDTLLNVNNNLSDADQNTPLAHDIEVHKGDSLPDVHTVLDNESSLSHVANVNWGTTPSTATVGNKAATIKVTYEDGSEDSVGIIVHVWDDASRYTPEGRDLETTVGHVPAAQDGIANVASMPVAHNNGITWASEPDVTHAGVTVPAIINVKFEDGSSSEVTINVKVDGMADHDDAFRNTPIGQDINANLGEHVADSRAQEGIVNKSSMTDVSGYTWGTRPDTATVGDKSAIVKVSYRDGSADFIPITVHVSSDASRDTVDPLGQNINKHVGDPISAEEGIQNAAHFTGEGVGFSFEGVTDPSTITRTAGTKGENVVLTYRDGSTKIVPILVNVTDNSGSHTPGHAHHDADDYDPQGKTIERDLHEAIGDAKDGIANASALPNDATYTWTDPAAAGHLTDTTGLKSAQVTVTYADNSTDVVTVYVHVTSDADRLGRNITGKTITKNVGESVSASEGVSNPDSVSITPVWDSTEDIDASGKTIAAGSYDETIKVTFGDGSSKIVHATLNVNEHRTNADVYSPVGGQIIKHVDDFLDNTDANDAIDNNNVMPAGTTYVWAAPVDTSSEGIKRGVVTVGFADGSSKNVNVSVKVISYANDPAFAPIGQDIHVDRPSTTPLSGTNRAEDGIQNADELRNVVSTTVPAYTWVTPVDISRADSTNTGIVKVTYKDGSSRNIAVNVIVGHPATGSNVTEAEPEAKVIEAHYGDVFDPADQNNAKKGIANVGDLPSGVVYSFISPVPVDSTTHKINQTGNIPVIIHITNNSGYDKRVATILHVTSDADNYNPTPRPIVIDPSHPVDPTNPNVPTNPNDSSDPTRPVGPSNPVNPTPGVDPSTVPSGTTVTWPTDPSGNPIVPDTHTPGDHPTDVVLHYPDGSSETVPTNVHVPTPTPSTPGTRPTDADQNDPIGTTIEKDMSTPTHPVSLTDDDAKNAIANSGSLHDVAGYSWDFAPDISTHGLKHGRVKVSYNDHTYDLVDVGVDVKSMADRFNPDPRPVTVDPRDPSHPIDPSDPTNPTPGVDPSTVPSGTTTGWPTDPSGNPVVPDRTPGDHPTTIVVHYPDGSESHIPTINHMPSSVITPVPRPINVTPGEDPSHITDPNTNGNGATPGVDPDSVPNGSHTELVPGQTIDTQTPGTHPVNIQVRYPDGTTSAPIPTTIVVPSPVSRPINVTPGEDPSHIVDPNINGNGATPGVDPSTVPSGSHTELVPGQTIDTQTPGTHPVNIQVRYPDGTTSAPIPTTIVVPSPEETYAPEETTQPAPTAPETITTHVVFTDHDHEIVSFPITGKEGETIPLAKIKELIKEKMPKGYIVDMNLEKAWKEGKFVISAKQPIYIKIAKAHRQLVLFIDKKGRIVKRVYVVVKNRQKFTKNFVHDLSKKHQPKGYKMTSYRKVAKHLDIFVSGKKTKATDYGKLVLYVGKDGKIIKRANVNETKGRFDKKNAKKHLPKGYKMSNHKHINRHVDVWVNKKQLGFEEKFDPMIVINN